MQGAFYDKFIWRLTGFPCEMLEELAIDDLATSLRGVIRSDANIELPWHRRWQKIDASPAMRELRQPFERKFFAVREKLHRTAHDPRFLLAVSCTSPKAVEAVKRISRPDLGVRRYKEKRRELLAIRFLQRFVTKCETTAFFGGVATGSFDDLSTFTDYNYRLSGYQPSIFIGDRFLRSLISRLRNTADVMRTLSVQRSGAVMMLGGHTLLHMSRGIKNVSTEEAELLGSLKNPARVSRILRASKSPHKTLLRIRRLLSSGLLTDELDLAWQKNDALAYLRSLVSRAGNRGEPLIALIDTLRSEFSQILAASAEERNRTLNKVIAQAQEQRIFSRVARPEGSSFYCDHLPFIEDGVFLNAKLRLDRAHSQAALEGVEKALLSKSRLDARNCYAAKRQMACALKDKFNGATPLRDILNYLLDPALTKRQHNGCCSVEGEIPAAPIVASPDVMIARTSPGLDPESCDWILSEVHSGIGASGCFVRVMADAEEWLDGISNFVGREMSGYEPAMLSIPILNKTAHSGNLKSISYIQGGSAPYDESHVVQVEDLTIEINRDEVQLKLRANGKEAYLLTPSSNFIFDLLKWFRTPLIYEEKAISDQREYTDGIISSRARWRLENIDLPLKDASPLEVFSWAQLLRETYGLPRWLFTKPGTETKPLCIDLSNPFLCEELLRHLRQQNAITLEEMYPSPDEAWISSEEGRHLAEMRMLYVGKV